MSCFIQLYKPMNCVCINSALNYHKPFYCIVVARCAFVMPLVYLIITGAFDLHVLGLYLIYRVFNLKVDRILI
jgi:hypothetical protein